MPLTVTTWNINSVRLRLDLVAKFIRTTRPDLLCLQETKCPDDRFPLKRFRRLGYEHVALNGQKGYHGVVVLSRLPFESFTVRTFCDTASLSVTKQKPKPSPAKLSSNEFLRASPCPNDERFAGENGGDSQENPHARN